MLKCNITSVGNECSIISSGNIIELCCDITYIISRIYSSVKANNPEDAERLRATLIAIVEHPDSPVWNFWIKGDDEG